MFATTSIPVPAVPVGLEVKFPLAGEPIELIALNTGILIAVFAKLLAVAPYNNPVPVPIIVVGIAVNC